MTKLPPLATTGIGSLPDTSAAKACSKILSFGLTAPFWPQLPKRDFLELMTVQFSEGFPCLVIDKTKRKIWCHIDNTKSSKMQEFYDKLVKNSPEEFAISEEYAPGLHSFLRMAPAKSDFVKGHLTGPLTFSLGISDQNGTPIYYDRELREAAVHLLMQKALFEIELLRKLSPNVIIFIDEPILAAYGSSAYVGVSEEDVISCESELVSAIKNSRAYCGLHCCGNTDWSLVIRTGVDIVSFDAYSYAHTVALYADSVSAFLDRGGYLAWGIVPTTQEVSAETANSLAKRLSEGFSMLSSKGIKRETLQERAILTPSCGAGLLSEPLSLRVLQLLTETALLLR
jgi:hypothetical protein